MPRIPALLQLAFASLLTAAISGPLFMILVLFGASLGKMPDAQDLTSAIPFLFFFSGIAAVVAIKIAIGPALIAGGLLWLMRDQAWARARLTFLACGALVGVAMPALSRMFKTDLIDLFDAPHRFASISWIALPLTGALCGLIFRAVMDSSAPFFGTDEPALGD